MHGGFMSNGEFIEQPDGTFLQDRGDVVCIVWSNGNYAFTTRASYESGNLYLPCYGKCVDVETAMRVADLTGWAP